MLSKLDLGLWTMSTWLGSSVCACEAMGDHCPKHIVSVSVSVSVLVSCHPHSSWDSGQSLYPAWLTWDQTPFCILKPLNPYPAPCRQMTLGGHWPELCIP